MGNETDRLSLLAIKAKIVDDPLHALSPWNDSIHFCQWQGVMCGRKHQRVIALDLQSSELVGSISPHLGNLSFLREVQLQNNSFGNEIPPEIGQQVPVELGSLSKLETIIIRNNNLTRSISPFANLPSLLILSLANNYFDGNIPDGFGRLKNLQELILGINRSIPVSMSNASQLHYLLLLQNKLTGKVPNLARLQNLQWLCIWDNQLGSGEADDFSFMFSLINATNLQRLEVSMNNFSGKLPEYIGNLSRNLEYLYVDHNQIFGSIPPGIVNLVGLQSLLMQVNQFTSTIPIEIGKVQNLHELILYINSLDPETQFLNMKDYQIT
ncbi:putative receptor-like protein kinase At3g47110 [Camellia sinensis]|uniref:putative receptor-like protein kinase At3g47110 n=1 Tax=Camellia sinensis TaxID=4442 RepID=UPI0010364D54|nr:putative receptor-like protein kinase At3g47110 [Camellia sinensis]